MWRNQTSALAVLLLTGVVVFLGCAEKESVEDQSTAVPAPESNDTDAAVASDQSTTEVEESSDEVENQAEVVTSEENEEEVQASKPGTEEFGMTPRQLVQSIEKVEALIAECMREQGFEYIAADYLTVRKGMSADKSMPGMSEEEFIKNYGYGVSTMYTGIAPQLVEGYSPAREGLDERNVQIFQNLSSEDQVAYNRALFGDNADTSLAVGLEIENFSRCGGCTRKAIEQVFEPEQLKDSYYNPKDAMVNNHPFMKSALRVYASEMRDAGFTYSHPDEVEADFRKRLDAITDGGKIPVSQMTPDQLAALKELQEYERRVAVVDFRLAQSIFDPVEERIHEEMYPREVK